MKKICFIIIIFLVGCKQSPPDPTELYNKYRKSVALVYNSYYFKTSLDNGMEFHYTIEDGDLTLYDSEYEAIENASVTFGTAFFISEKGELATNRHVIFPDVDEDLIGEEINEYLSELKYRVRIAINDNENEQGTIVELYNEYHDHLSVYKRNELRDEYYKKKNENIELEKLLGSLNFNPSNTRTELKRVFLGIAYDDTHISHKTDFIECIPVKRSTLDLVDLAIIQLKNKQTPNFINPFSITTKNIEVEINDVVYMIGFNHGYTLAKTDHGIKSQFTQGTVTQDPDYSKILYSIPTLPGSSGSPIIDKWGNLVAINFAKTIDFQGFSFGIPTTKLVDLYNLNNNGLNEYLIKKQPENLKKEKQPENLKKEKQPEKESEYHYEESGSRIDFVKKIENFIEAENVRDFEKIYSYFSPNNIQQYWNVTNPNKSDLRKLYESSWKITSDAKNKIEKIEKIDNQTYNYYTIFGYYHNSKKEWYRVQSKMRIVFDSKGRIIQVYNLESNQEVADEWVNYDED